MNKKEILIRWLIVVWFVGLLAGVIALSETSAASILTIPLALAGTIVLLMLELFGLRKLHCKFEGRTWGIILLVLFSLHFSVVFYFLIKLFFVALVVLAGRIILGIVGAIPVSTVRTVYRDQNHIEHEVISSYIGDQADARRMAEDEIKRQNPDAKIVDQD